MTTIYLVRHGETEANRQFRFQGCIDLPLTEDGIAQAERLAERLNRGLRSRTETMPIHVNLIPVNPVSERSFSGSDSAAIRAFADVLEKRGIRATVRRRLGSDINASCGQLRRGEV